MQVDILHRDDLRVAPSRCSAFHTKDRPSDGSRRQIMASLPILRSASPRPTVVVVLPSPAGVGLIAVTQNQLGRITDGLLVKPPEVNLGLGSPIGLQRLLGYTEQIGNLRNGLNVCRLSYFDIERMVLPLSSHRAHHPWLAMTNTVSPNGDLMYPRLRLLTPRD